MSEVPSEEKLTDSEEKQEISKEHEVEVEEKETSQLKRVVAEVIRSEEFSGPIPHPEIIKGYEKVLPGSADRIISMAENQSKHRQDLEKMMVRAEVRDSLLGILFAFALGLSCIAASIVIVVTVPETAGAIASALFGITGIGSIIVTFIKSTRSNRGTNENEKK